jgi:hypothetical protein
VHVTVFQPPKKSSVPSVSSVREFLRSGWSSKFSTNPPFLPPKFLAKLLLASYLASPLDMSWKRAQIHAESMLETLGIGEKQKGKKDLRGKKVIFVDDGKNPYRTMCFTIGAKLAKRRGAEIETVTPGPGELPHAKVVEVTAPPKPKIQRPINRR